MGKPGTWRPGESGNPHGRPPKNRAWAEILDRAGCKTLDYRGKRISRKRLIAELAMQVATRGQAEFPDGQTLTLEAKDWFDIVKFIYTHIDGPVKAEMDITSAGEQIGAVQVVEVVKDGPR